MQHFLTYQRILYIWQGLLFFLIYGLNVYEFVYTLFKVIQFGVNVHYWHLKRLESLQRVILIKFYDPKTNQRMLNIIAVHPIILKFTEICMSYYQNIIHWSCNIIYDKVCKQNYVIHYKEHISIMTNHEKDSVNSFPQNDKDRIICSCIWDKQIAFL